MSTAATGLPFDRLGKTDLECPIAAPRPMDLFAGLRSRVIKLDQTGDADGPSRLGHPFRRTSGKPPA